MKGLEFDLELMTEKRSEAIVLGGLGLIVEEVDGSFEVELSSRVDEDIKVDFPSVFDNKNIPRKEDLQTILQYLENDNKLQYDVLYDQFQQSADKFYDTIDFLLKEDFSNVKKNFLEKQVEGRVDGRNEKDLKKLLFSFNKIIKEYKNELEGIEKEIQSFYDTAEREYVAHNYISKAAERSVRNLDLQVSAVYNGDLEKLEELEELYEAIGETSSDIADNRVLDMDDVYDTLQVIKTEIKKASETYTEARDMLSQLE